MPMLKERIEEMKTLCQLKSWNKLSASASFMSLAGAVLVIEIRPENSCSENVSFRR